MSHDRGERKAVGPRRISGTALVVGAAVVVLATGALVSCASETSTPASDLPVTGAPQSSTLPGLLPDDPAEVPAGVLGATEADAVAAIERAGLRHRVVRRDDETFIVTDDYRLDRVNLVVENGRVVAADVG